MMIRVLTALLLSIALITPGFSQETPATPGPLNLDEPLEETTLDEGKKSSIEIITEDSVDDTTITATNPPDAPLGDGNWRDNFGGLFIGFVNAGQTEARLRKMELFRKVMQRRLRIPVRFRTAPSLDKLIEMQMSRRVQYAIHTASSFATMQVLCKCSEPLVAPTDHQGAEGIHAVVIAPFDGAVRSLNDLKGKRLALPAPPATLTRAWPLHKLKTLGFDEPGDLGAFVDVAHPVAGWKKVLDDKADAVVGWSTLKGDYKTGFSSGTLQHLIEITGLAKTTDVRIVWQSEFIPFGPHVIRTDIPTPLKKALRGFLVTLKDRNPYVYDAIEPNYAGGFVRREERDYIPLLKMVRPEPAEKG